MFLRAVALVYRFNWGFAIDGKLAPEHEKAFARGGGPQKLKLQERLTQPSQEAEEVIAIRKAATAAPCFRGCRLLERSRTAAEQNIATLEEQLERSEAESDRREVEERISYAKEENNAPKQIWTESASVFSMCTNIPLFCRMRSKTRLAVSSSTLLGSLGPL